MNAHLRTVTVALVVLAVAAGARAQSGDAQRPRFEVVSVKPNKSGEGVIQFQIQPGGRFVVVDIPLKQLIRAAHTDLYRVARTAGPSSGGATRSSQDARDRFR